MEKIQMKFDNTSRLHLENIESIVDNHFTEVEKRIDPVYNRHFGSFRKIMARHWNNKKDIPLDLAAIPRFTWNIFASKILKKKVKPLPKSGKVKELEYIISEELLGFAALEKKIEAYVTPFQLAFEREFSEILLLVPAPNRSDFSKILESKIENLTTPVEGCREAVMFLVAGIVGKIFSDKIVFGSMMSTGKAIAGSVYLSQLSGFGVLWANLFGMPVWVGVAGAASGMVAGLMIAPLLSPMFEFGMNRVRAKKILTDLVHSSRNKLLSDKPDALNVGGRIAIFLQLFPEIIYLARNTLKGLA